MLQVKDDELTRTNIHALGGIKTHGPSIQAIKAFSSGYWNRLIT
jgi:hypothetical protein